MNIDRVNVRSAILFNKLGGPTKVTVIKLGIKWYSFKPIIFNWAERLDNHMGGVIPSTVGSSGESWSLNESLNQRFVEMKDQLGRDDYGSCKVCAQTTIMIICLKRTPG